MSDRLPYEEQVTQQWNDLPLPDESMAWADMKRRLDKDDDDGIIPIWLRGCGLWGLLAVGLLAIGWWFVRPDKWGSKNQETKSETTIDQKENKNSSNNNNNEKINSDDTIHLIKSTDGKKPTDGIKDISTTSSADSSVTGLHHGQKKPLLKKEADISVVATNPKSKKKETGSKEQKNKETIEKNKKPFYKKVQNQTETEQVDISIQPGAKNKKTGNDTVVTKNNPVVKNSDSLSVTSTVNTGRKDSVHIIPPDSVQKKKEEQITKTNEPKKDSSKPKKISFSAGIAMHQLIPIDGQKLTPYNSAGRKGSLADYIPAVYGRMYRNDKWFLQLEFRYGAPQSTKEFLYQQKAKLDTIQGNVVTTTASSTLKKTFYHQLPLTFNYFLLPNWSIGTGVVWNKFVSAASQQKVTRGNNSAQPDSVISNGIVKDKNDSLFKKSYFQAVFETQYRWRRFSLGARYSFGLQPYIEFTLPGGKQQKERNKSLQVFLRYEIWKSKAKR
jgi:hypothetical protein